jgi:hypothetical protein
MHIPPYGGCGLITGPHTQLLLVRQSHSLRAQQHYYRRRKGMAPVGEALPQT